MTIGINAEVCGNVDCEYAKVGPMGFTCWMGYPVTEYECTVRGHMCPVPEECPYRALHIVSGRGVIKEDKCNKICLKTANDFFENIKGTKYDYRNQF